MAEDYSMRLIILILAFLIAGNAHASRTSEEPTEYFNRLATAIFYAEGGYKTPYPYGIMSVKVKGKGAVKVANARQICLNTIRNKYRMYLASGSRENFIDWLARIYAPIGDNDPKNLNWEWPRNVKKIMVRLYGSHERV